MQRLPPYVFRTFLSRFLENSAFWDCIQVYFYAIIFSFKKSLSLAKTSAKPVVFW